MKRISLPIACFFFLCVFPLLRGQTLSTDGQLKQKYWNYRERLKKYFTHIGKQPGESLILHQHNKGKQGGSLPACVLMPYQPTVDGFIKFGECAGSRKIIWILVFSFLN